MYIDTNSLALGVLLGGMGVLIVTLVVALIVLFRKKILQ